MIRGTIKKKKIDIERKSDINVNSFVVILPLFSYLFVDVNSTFGNLESTAERIEVIFNIIVVTAGLILVTMLIGNIKVP